MLSILQLKVSVDEGGLYIKPSKRVPFSGKVTKHHSDSSRLADSSFLQGRQVKDL